MRKILCTILALIALSGCGSPVKKPAPSTNPVPNQSGNSQNNGNSSNQGRNSGQNQELSGGNVPDTNSGKPIENAADQASKAAFGAETVVVNGKTMVKNPGSILVLVNKTRNLPSDWAPDDLAIPDVRFPFNGDLPHMYMRKEAADALEELFNEALEDGIRLYAISGYRSYSTQQRIYNNEVERSGAQAANLVVALPGQSEHQTGLAMDVSSASACYGLQESFEDTKEGRWLKEHAKDAGFIIRYPKDKAAVTKYTYEPWHIRYVGKAAAEYMVSHNITLDEYFLMLASLL